MKHYLIVFCFFFAACGEANISIEEYRQKDTLSNADFNRILRKEHGMAMEGLQLLKVAGEDTSARRRVLLLHDHLMEWRDLVKEKISPQFVPSEEQSRLFEKVLEFDSEFRSFR